MLVRKSGFSTFDELKQEKELFSRQYGDLDGQLLLIEMNYLERTCFGGPGSGLGLVEETSYILGVIDRSLNNEGAGLVVMPVPIKNRVEWKKYSSALADVHCFSNPFDLGIFDRILSQWGKSQYRILVGDLEVMHSVALFESSKKERGIAQSLVLNFWKAATMLGVKTSEFPAISRALEAATEEALKEYVQKKIDLCSSKSDVKFENGVVTIPIESFFLKNPLLQLGLSEAAITFRATELALKKLGL